MLFYANFCDNYTADDRPTMAQLQRFGPKCINIPQQIGVKFTSFGHVLLDDRNGAIVKGIEYQYRQDAVRACTVILQQWLEGGGIQEKTWATIVDVLYHIDMNTLACDIEAVVRPQ